MVGKRWRACVVASAWRRTAALLLVVFSSTTIDAARADETPLGGQGKPEVRRASPNTGSRASDDTKGQTVAVPSAIELTPSAVRFANVPVGDMYSQTVRIANTGAGTVEIKKITVPGAEFGVSGVTWPFLVAGGTSANFTISYRPKAKGQATGEIRIVTSEGSAPVVMELRASAVEEQKELTASEASIDFEDVAVGGRCTKEVTLTNSGNRDLKISSVSVSEAEFSVSGAEGATLSAGQTISLEVSFAPKSAGPRSGKLTVVNNGSASSLEIPVTAAGAAASQSAIRLKWEESPVSVAGYMVYRSMEPSGPYSRISDMAVPSAEYVDGGLPVGRTYYYVVTSVDGEQGESEYSEPISATVPEG